MTARTGSVQWAIGVLLDKTLADAAAISSSEDPLLPIDIIAGYAGLLEHLAHERGIDAEVRVSVPSGKDPRERLQRDLQESGDADAAESAADVGGVL